MEEQVAENEKAEVVQPLAGNRLFCMPYACNLLLGLLCLLAVMRLTPVWLAALFEPLANSAPHESLVFTVDINTATVAELQALPEIGQALANRIVEHRTASGGFKVVDELQDVHGFGSKRLENLRSLISVQAVAEQTGGSLTRIHGQLNAN